jgi:threonine aldolase
VMFCLSKGLCAPVGSLLVGSRELVVRARVYRKALGGGMRQAGVLAAAGLIALEEMPARLGEDHANAKLLAERLAGVPGILIDAKLVETNIVIFELGSELEGDAGELVARLKECGVLSATVGPRSIRFVTHRDVSRLDCELASVVVAEVLRTVC